MKNKVDQLVTDLQEVESQERAKEAIIKEMWDNTKELLGGYYWLLMKDLKVNVNGNISDYCVVKVGLTYQPFHNRLNALKLALEKCNFTHEVIRKQSIFDPGPSHENKIRKKCGITFQPSDIGYNYNTTNALFKDHPMINFAYHVGMLFGVPTKELASKLPSTEFVIMKTSEIPKLKEVIDAADKIPNKMQISEYIVAHLDLDINISSGTTITVSWDLGTPGNFSFVVQ